MTTATELTRLPTGIAGLDEVLAGGLVQTGIYLVAGSPGTGKTVFGNHFAFNYARGGGTALFVTVLAETHSRMLAHLRGFRFFDPELVGQRIHYLNIYGELQRNELKGALDLLRDTVRKARATLLVIDGAAVLEDFVESPLAFRHFVYELNAQLTTFGCTGVLLADYDSAETHAIGAHADGIITLEDQRVDLRDIRLLRVVKLRGANYLRGQHPFAITTEGIEVYPRLETRRLTAVAPEMQPPRPGPAAIGVAGLDEMLHGGLPAGTATMAIGVSGAGKTILGLHFISEGARQGEPGLYVSFQESPAELVRQAERFGLELERHVRSGRVHLIWQPSLEQLADAWAQQVLAAVAEQQTRRLVIDSISEAMQLQGLTAQRLTTYLGSFTDALRAQGVTALYTAQATTVIGEPLTGPPPLLSVIVENAILLRYVELRSQLRRLLSVIKLHGSGQDTSIREFAITARGIYVDEIFSGTEAILTGVARSVETSEEPPTLEETK